MEKNSVSPFDVTRRADASYLKEADAERIARRELKRAEQRKLENINPNVKKEEQRRKPELPKFVSL